MAPTATGSPEMEKATSRYRTYRTPFHSCRLASSTDAYHVTVREMSGQRGLNVRGDCVLGWELVPVQGDAAAQHGRSPAGQHVGPAQRRFLKIRTSNAHQQGHHSGTPAEAGESKWQVGVCEESEWDAGWPEGSGRISRWRVRGKGWQVRRLHHPSSRQCLVHVAVGMPPWAQLQPLCGGVRGTRGSHAAGVAMVVARWYPAQAQVPLPMSVRNDSLA